MAWTEQDIVEWAKREHLPERFVALASDIAKADQGFGIVTDSWLAEHGVVLPASRARILSALQAGEPGSIAVGGYDYAVLWMHGLGDTEVGWRGAVLNRVPLAPRFGRCKYIFPRAPRQAVSCNGGAVMTSWFDMEDLPLGADDRSPQYGCSFAQAEASAARVRQMLDDLREGGVPSERIVVGGFSQGGAMAMLTCLTYPHRLAACVCFSGILLGSDQLDELATQEARDLPLFWAHGSADDVLEPSLQDAGLAALSRLGMPLTSKTYPVGHAAHPQGLADAAQFLNGVLDLQSTTD